MHILHVATAAFGTRSASPFATKALSLMTLSGIDFERVDTMPNLGPRKKIPFLELPSGEVLADSHNIERHLRDQGLLDLPSTPADILVRRVVEEHLYFAQMHFRWGYHLEEVREAFFGELPAFVRPVVLRMVRRSVDQSLWGQGFGRRPEPEMLAIIEEDLDALEYALDGKAFFGGVSASSADIAAHALLDQLLPTSFDDPFATAIRRRATLASLHERVEHLVYGPPETVRRAS